MSNLSTFVGYPRQPYVKFGAFVTPGFATPKGAGSPRNWEVQQGWGAAGAAIYYRGDMPTAFDVDVFLFKPEHFVLWNVFAAGALQKPKYGQILGAAMDVGHPLLNGPPWSIKSCVILDVTQFEQGPTGGWACTIKCLEWRKPVIAYAREVASIPEAPGVTVTAQSVADAALLAAGKQNGF